jgi:hypothetical protein
MIDSVHTISAQPMHIDKYRFKHLVGKLCLVAVLETGFLFPKQQNCFYHVIVRLAICFKNRNSRKQKRQKHEM